MVFSLFLNYEIYTFNIASNFICFILIYSNNNLMEYCRIGVVRLPDLILLHF